MAAAAGRPSPFPQSDAPPPDGRARRRRSAGLQLTAASEPAAGSTHLMQQPQRGEPRPVAHAEEQRCVVQHQQLHILWAAGGEAGRRAGGGAGRRAQPRQRWATPDEQCRAVAAGGKARLGQRSACTTLSGARCADEAAIAAPSSQLDQHQVLLLGKYHVQHPRLCQPRVIVCDFACGREAGTPTNKRRGA